MLRNGACPPEAIERTGHHAEPEHEHKHTPGLDQVLLLFGHRCVSSFLSAKMVASTSLFEMAHSSLLERAQALVEKTRIRSSSPWIFACTAVFAAPLSPFLFAPGPRRGTNVTRTVTS